ncbi:hypothetical protein AC249_AIPGENE5060 [Exaiptasia diaphana]|nr:hypothetical protein AC249_AIPGENE5060 [Exaiptasia diaphana]
MLLRTKTVKARLHLQFLKRDLSSVNPIIYSLVNSEFRREFSSHLHCNGDNCCLDASENLTTVHKSNQALQNPDRRRNSTPLLNQDQAYYTPVERQSENPVMNNGTLLANIEETHSKPSSRPLVIKVNPTYETGGF